MTHTGSASSDASAIRASSAISSPRIPGGDALYLQQQNFSLEALARRDASDDPFAKSGAGSRTTSDDANGKSMSESELTAAKAMLRGLLTK
ncbi:portal protein [Enterobacter hormaechei]